MRINSALVFGAGFGTRMGVLTKDVPKPLIRVAERPLIDYTLDLAHEADLKTIVVNLHYLPEKLEEHLKTAPRVKTIREEPNILETGGGLRNALPLLGDGPVFTLNSDAIWTGRNPLTILERYWNSDRMDALLMLVPKENAQEHRGVGDFHMNEEGILTRRGESESAPFVYSGAQIIKTNKLKSIQKDSFSVNVLWDKMLANQRVFGVVHGGGWVDVGRPEGIAIAEKEIQRNV